MHMADKNKIRKLVSENYGAIAAGKMKSSCCASGCDCESTPAKLSNSMRKLGYSCDDVMSIPSGAGMSLGCGNPLAIAALQPGETVLDLGSGAGFDCFLARKRVGRNGHVIGVDMTIEMLALARKNAENSGYDNVEFRLGEIEHLPVTDNTIDVIISNCVINLSPEKDKVFAEAYRVLKPGGRLSISDVVATARLPESILNDMAMLAGCIAGAEYLDDLRAIIESAGFKHIKMTPKDNSKEIISSWVPDRGTEDYVTSFIIEAVKPQD